MSFIKRVLQDITIKQREAMRDVTNKVDSMMEKSPFDYLGRLQTTILQHLEQNMDQHEDKIHQYLFQTNNTTNMLYQGYFVEDIVSTIHKKQQEQFQSLEQALGQDDQFVLDIYTDKTVERKVRRQSQPPLLIAPKEEKQNIITEKQVVQVEPTAEAQRVPLIQQVQQVEQAAPTVQVQTVKEDSPQSNKDVRVHSSDLAHLKGEQVIQNKAAEEKRQVAEVQGIREDRIASQKIGQQRKIHVQHTNMAGSEIVGKRDIVRQLEERRKKLLEKDHKAKKLKSKLIKLEPIARKEDVEARSREAKEKISQQIQFVRGLQNKKKNTQFKITEWKQERSIKTVEKKQETPPQKYSHKNVDLYRNRFGEYSFEEGTTALRGSGNRLERSVVRGDKNFILSKPLPYNLYNVSTKNELFQLK